MPVPLPRVCAVLAHELRSPLSVIQGYIRLLQRQRDADHPDTAMLEAMLQSTARLTAIARQASDLGLWLTALETTPLPTVSLGDVVDALTERAQNTASVRIAASDVATAPRLNAESRPLADAVIALAESMARETGEAEIEVSISASTADAATRFVLRPRTYAGPPVSPPSRAAAERAVTFDRGGAGLGLVLASYVLDAHGATVTPDESGHISLQFPPERGAQ
jgi:light-regulated signal transduction histidine kinase (bacteriophytochrome)